MKPSLFLFVSPHSKKIGETYILPKFLRDNKKSSICFFLFNATGEWDHLSDATYVIENPMKFIVRFSPNIERFSPWLNYRIWLSFASISIFLGLIFKLREITKSHNVSVIARMSTSAVALIPFFYRSKDASFIASMAGVPLSSPLRNSTWPIIYRNFRKIVSPSLEMNFYLKSYLKLDENSFSRITNPMLSSVNKDKLRRKIRSRDYFLGKRPLRVLCVGRLTRQKGFDTLLTALAQVDFDFRLEIVGEGELEDNLKRQAEKLGLTGKVQFQGYDPKPFRSSDETDLFVMPSRWEGPGHTIMEALSHGIPSIVSDCPYGPSETVGKGKYGLVFKTDCIDDLTCKLNHAVANYREFKEMLIASTESLSQYTIEEVREKWLDIIDER